VNFLRFFTDAELDAFVEYVREEQQRRFAERAKAPAKTVKRLRKLAAEERAKAGWRKTETGMVRTAGR
jgi:polyphosphate kinase 2 (PPK2 family)